MHNHGPPWISMEFHELTNTVKNRKQPWLVDEWSVHWFSWKSSGQTKNYKKVPQSRKTNKPRIRGTRVQSTNLETPSFLLGTRAGEQTATNPHKQFSYRCLHGDHYHHSAWSERPYKSTTKDQPGQRGGCAHFLRVL